MQILIEQFSKYTLRNELLESELEARQIELNTLRVDRVETLSSSFASEKEAETNENKYDFETVSSILEARQINKTPVKRETSSKSPFSKKFKKISNKNQAIQAVNQNLDSTPDCQPLDTIELAKTINGTLKAHKISKTLLGTSLLGMCDTDMARLLNHPRPWANCTDCKKSHWQKMYEWSQSTEAIRSLEAEQKT